MSKLPEAYSPEENPSEMLKTQLSRRGTVAGNVHFLHQEPELSCFQNRARSVSIGSLACTIKRNNELCKPICILNILNMLVLHNSFILIQ